MKNHRPLEAPVSLPARLESERLVLRPLVEADAAAVFAYASDPLVSRYLSWVPHASIEDSLAFIKQVRAGYESAAPPLWGLELKETGGLVGTISLLALDHHHCYGQVGYVVGCQWWGRGIAPEATRAVIEHAFGELGLNRIEAQVRVENEPSARVLEKAGLRQEAILRQRFFIAGQFHDSRLYAVLREEWERRRRH